MPRKPSSSAVNVDMLHDRVSMRMASSSQRYTTGRRLLVDALARAVEPLDMAQIVQAVPDVPQSSAYRSLAIFSSLGIVTRIAGRDETGYFEISEDFLGSHHHHAVCQQCGRVADIESSPRLERALQDAAKVAGDQSGFQFDAHRIDLVGTCADCQ